MPLKKNKMTNFKRYCFLFLFIVGQNLMAQPISKKEKIDALRAEFISKKVKLNAQEAQAFWPLYNEMNDKIDHNKRVFRQQYGNINLENEKEAEAFLSAELTMRQKEIETQRDYYEKCKKIMSASKLAQIRRAEEDFKKELIKTIKEN
jgi:malic enzyme